jgi:O-succinylbenzoic acid--CoA ligase
MKEPYFFVDFDTFNISKIAFQDSYYDQVLDFVISLKNENWTLQVKSSGSTGTPKVFNFTKVQAITSAKISNSFFGINKNSILFLPLSIEFIAAKMLLIRAFEAKCKIYIVKPSANPIKDLHKKIDFISLTPYQVQNILEQNPKKFNLIKKCLIGGAAMPSKWIQKLKEIHSTCLYYESFGMTETLSHFAIKELLTDHLGFKKLTEYQIATNLEQQLVISHPIIVPNPLTTNDIVEIIDSDHFNFIGRKDFTVNSGGIKIQIEPLENEMEKFIHFPFFLSKKNDTIFGEKLVFCFLKKENILNEQIFELFKSIPISKYQIPKELIRLETFKYTENGKIIRKLDKY